MSKKDTKDKWEAKKIVTTKVTLSKDKNKKE